MSSFKFFNLPVEERDVANYRREAMAMICRFAGTKTDLMYDEDAITNVASAIAKAEYDFDPSRGYKRVTLRMTYGKYQVWKELRLQKKRRETFSLDRAVHNANEDTEKTYGIDVEDHRECASQKMEEDEEREKRKKMAHKMIQCSALTQKQREYLKLRYVKDISVKEIAERKKCSKQAVSQILLGAISRLRGMYFEGNLSGQAK